MRSREWNQGQNGPPSAENQTDPLPGLTQIDLSRF
jgi:hypothetical protein